MAAGEDSDAEGGRKPTAAATAKAILDTNDSIDDNDDNDEDGDDDDVAAVAAAAPKKGGTTRVIQTVPGTTAKGALPLHCKSGNATAGVRLATVDGDSPINVSQINRLSNRLSHRKSHHPCHCLSLLLIHLFRPSYLLPFLQRCADVLVLLVKQLLWLLLPLLLQRCRPNRIRECPATANANTL